MLLRFTAPIIALGVAAFLPPPAIADGPDAESPVEEAAIESSQQSTDVQIIELDSLPVPPSRFATLIQRGSVRFVTGGRPQSDPQTLPLRGRLAGETRYRFRYRYDSHARWRLLPSRQRDNESDRLVEVNVRFRSLRWIVDHDVWLRDPPAPEDFWNDPIVAHEFDHVRLSAAPRIEEQFMKAAKQLRSFRVPFDTVAADGRIDAVKVRAVIKSRMSDALSNTSDYVRIRYRELDRLTDHGLRPLPQDAGLIEID